MLTCTWISASWNPESSLSLCIASLSAIALVHALCDSAVSLSLPTCTYPRYHRLLCSVSPCCCHPWPLVLLRCYTLRSTPCSLHLACIIESLALTLHLQPCKLSKLFGHGTFGAFQSVLIHCGVSTSPRRLATKLRRRTQVRFLADPSSPTSVGESRPI